MIISFIVSFLESGNLLKLTEAVQALANVFKSYRFLDYLLSKPHVEGYPIPILEALSTLRNFCPLPFHMTPLYNTS